MDRSWRSLEVCEHILTEKLNNVDQNIGRSDTKLWISKIQHVHLLERSSPSMQLR